MSLSIPERLAAAHAGSNPTIICRVPSGWVVLCDLQYLHGYSILLADPVAASLNDLDPLRRAAFLDDMARIGDGLLEVTGAARINYAICGNSDPFLHAHVMPRFSNEPEAVRRNHPWSYPQAEMDANRFDPDRDREMMRRLADAIQRRL